jgi:hypothetical protein
MTTRALIRIWRISTPRRNVLSLLRFLPRRHPLPVRGQTLALNANREQIEHNSAEESLRLHIHPSVPALTDDDSGSDKDMADFDAEKECFKPAALSAEEIASSSSPSMAISSAESAAGLKHSFSASKSAISLSGAVVFNLFSVGVERKRLPSNWKWVPPGEEAETPVR